MARRLVLIVSCLSFGFYLPAQVATINLNGVKQYIDGFGASTAWHGKISDTEANAAFNNTTNNQLGLSILRVRIDPAGSSRWGDELSNAQKAKSRGAKIFATPWTPPASMKTNNNAVGGELKTSSYADYANYLKSFRTYMSNGNAPVEVISVQNEPDIKVTYESCDWTGAQIQTFCANNAASIGGDVMVSESFNFNTALSDPTLNNTSSAANIAYIGGHLYGRGPFNYTNALNKNKKIWMTEHYYDPDDIGTCMTMAKEIADCMNYNMNAYIWWYLRMPGCNLINSDGSVKKKGYIMGQFSKFIRPGYSRVDVNYNPQTGIYVCAFKGDSKCVVVVVNQSTSSKSQQFALQNGSVSSMTKYTTSSSKNILNEGSVTLSNGKFTSTLDAQSVTTFVGAGVVTSIEEGVMDVNSTVYPNPFDGQGIQISMEGDFNYRISSVSGALVESGKGNDSKQVGQSLIAGIYYITIEGNKHRIVKKIIRH